jgi:hypothetical protein
VVSFGLAGGIALGRAQQAAAAKTVSAEEVDGFLAIGADGKVTVYSGKVEWPPEGHPFRLHVELLARSVKKSRRFTAQYLPCLNERNGIPSVLLRCGISIRPMTGWGQNQ